GQVVSAVAADRNAGGLREQSQGRSHAGTERAAERLLPGRLAGRNQPGAEQAFRAGRSGEIRDANPGQGTWLSL
ncbi:FIG00955006: hypothetical protein, partial [Pseudomonas fluorescens]